MQVKITSVAVTPKALGLGLRIEYAPDGPIRFARVLLEDDVLDWQALTALAAYLDRQYRRHMDREREAVEEQALPGL